MLQDFSFGDGGVRRSKTIHVAMICGSTFAWCNKMQTTVALITDEAEYMALSTSSHEVIFLGRLLTNLGEHLAGNTSTFEDKKGYEATIVITTAKTTHIDIRPHFVRDLVKSKALEIVWIPYSEMIADILSKNSLPILVHKKHTDKMLGGTYSGTTTRPIHIRYTTFLVSSRKGF